MYQINGYTLLWDAYQREEDLLNSILYELEQSKDKKLRDKVTKKILNSHRLMSKTKLEEDGFISIDVGSSRERGRDKEEDYNLRYLIQGWALRSMQTMKRAKATIIAIRQVLEDLGLNLKSVKATLKAFEEQFSKDWALLPKYSRYTIGELGELGEKAKDLFTDYQVYPNYEEIEPDEDELQQNIKELKEGF
jgi:DNA-binding transcriptional MerR regulator